MRTGALTPAPADDEEWLASRRLDMGRGAPDVGAIPLGQAWPLASNDLHSTTGTIRLTFISG